MRRRAFLASVAASALASQVGLTAPASAATRVWRRPITNGGYGHVVAANPFASGEFACGGDVWGAHLTKDLRQAGPGWLPTMMGQTGIGGIYTRAVAYSLANPGTRYYGIGTLKGTGGNFSVSVGNALTSRSTAIKFATNLSGTAGDVWPRPAGHLIDVVMNGSTEVIWAAGYNGIGVSTDGGHTWQVFAATAVRRAIVSLTPSSALACHYNVAGLELVQAGKLTTIPNPGVLHDLRRIGSTVWAVGPAGIFTWNGTTLVQHPSSAFFAGKLPVSIDGVGNTLYVYTGTGGQYCAAKSTDGGNTWAWIGQNTRFTLPNGQPFWLAGHKLIFGGANHGGCTVAVDPQNPNNVAFAGKNGIAGSTDGGQTIYLVGPGGDETNGVHVSGVGAFGCPDTDWGGVVTTNDWASYKQASAGTPSTALSVSVGGHTYAVKTSNPRDFTIDGVSVADDTFRGGCIEPTGLGVDSAGNITVSLYTGGILTA